MKNEETNAIRRSGLTDIELEQVSGGCNNGHEPQWKPIGCRHPGCYKIVKVDVANQSSFKCPNGHINVISGCILIHGVWQKQPWGRSTQYEC